MCLNILKSNVVGGLANGLRKGDAAQTGGGDIGMVCELLHTFMHACIACVRACACVFCFEMCAGVAAAADAATIVVVGIVVVVSYWY